LISYGFDEEKLYKAFYEAHDSEEKGGHKSPHLRDLFEDINKKFGKGFLIKLDRYITAHEKKALESGGKITDGVKDVWEEIVDNENWLAEFLAKSV
jgi:hypothetical protein